MLGALDREIPNRDVQDLVGGEIPSDGRVSLEATRTVSRSEVLRNTIEEGPQVALMRRPDESVEAFLHRVGAAAARETRKEEVRHQDQNATGAKDHELIFALSLEA